MTQKTPFYQQHLVSKAKMVNFFGWELPLHYGSQLQVHLQVRQAIGMFDVSHMTIIDIYGDDAQEFLRYLLANNVDRLAHPGKALYTCMLNENGGVKDDLLVYYLGVAGYRIVVNAATGAKDLAWLQQHRGNFAITIKQRTDLSIIAIQGPETREKIKQIFNPTQIDAASTLPVFTCALVDDWLIARTGYTGEDGLEIILPAAAAVDLWQRLLSVGVTPCGLGARDTLRLEAGMNLYGQDMDETTTPLESALGWTIAWQPADRNFIGRKALEQQKQQGVSKQLVGLILQEKGVLRPQQQVIVEGLGTGTITSGSFSPTLKQAIALARIPAGNANICHVVIRDKQLPATIVKLPFVRNGKQAY